MRRRPARVVALLVAVCLGAAFFPRWPPAIRRGSRWEAGVGKTPPKAAARGDVGGTPAGVPWLVVAIPTLPRPREAVAPQGTALWRAVAAWARSLRPPEAAGVAVTVVAVRRPHAAFDAACGAFAGPWLTCLAVEERDGERKWPPRPTGVEEEFAQRRQERPSEAALRQTVDVVSVLRRVANRSRFVLMAEDDFEICEGALPRLLRAIQRASALQTEGFSALRVGFGLNGIILHNFPPRADVSALADYLWRHAHRRPPDHLAVEFFAKESKWASDYFGRRRVAAYRYNLFTHLGGAVSTLREETSWAMPGCDEELVSPILFDVEAWKPKECSHDDLWPCAAPLHNPP